MKSDVNSRCWPNSEYFSEFYKNKQLATSVITDIPITLLYLEIKKKTIHLVATKTSFNLQVGFPLKMTNMETYITSCP